MFEQNDLVLIPTKEIKGALIEYAKSKGVPVYQHTSANNFDTYPNLMFTGSQLSGYKSPDARTLGSIISIDEFIKKCDNHITTIIKISSDYNAILKDDGIHVGCQIITYETFGELSKLVEKFKKIKK